jgi:hypothetical protein
VTRTLLCLALLACAAPAAALTPAELFEQRSPSIFVVHAYDKQGKKIATGSGVVIGHEQVITNCHVLAKAADLAVSRGNVTYGASLEWPDPARDLCQLKVRELAAPAVPLGETATLKVGQRVFAIGAPQGLELTLSDGLVSSLREIDDGKPPLIQTTAPISPGSSGGALFDEQGRLVGITTFNFRGQQLNFAVPADWVREVPARGRDVLAKRKDEAQARAAVPAGAKVAAAAIDPSLPKEMPQVGDTWTYALLDVTYRPADRSRKFVHTVSKAGRGSVVETVSFEGAQIAQDAYSPEVIGVYRAKAQMIDVAPFLTAFRSLRPGEEWGPLPIRGMETISAGAVSGDIPYEVQAGHVIGQERISTAAGTFDAVRVEFNGRISDVLLGHNPTFRGYTAFTQTIWYVPAVKRAAKTVFQTPGFTTAYELESYSLR